MVDANIRAHDARNYQLPGRVSLWFRKKGSTNDADWRELGNVIDPTLAPQIERLDHFTQRRGVRAKDRSLVSSRSAQLNFSIDEINLHNLQFAFGNIDAPTDSTVDVNDSKVKANPGSGGTINLGELDIEDGSVVVRNTVLEDEVTYTAGVDYSIDIATGIITILAGALASSVDVPEIHVFYRKNVETQQFKLFPGTDVEGEAKFQVLTPAGMQWVAVFKNVTIKNNGDIGIGDGQDWQKIALTLDILEDDDGDLGTLHTVYSEELD